MSPVIKSTDGGSSRVRPLLFGSRDADLAAPSIDAEKVRLRDELELARASIAEREARLDHLATEAKRIAREAEENGYKAGLTAAEDLQAKRVAVLQDGVASALTQLSEEMESLERLAPLLAIEALARLVGDAGERGDLVRDIALRNIGLLDVETILRVEVSAADFPDTAILSQAIAGVAHRPLDVCQAPDLGAGDCRIRLVLGELEVGLNQQWGQLSALLRALATPEAIR